MYSAIEMRKRYIIYVRAILTLTLILIGLYNNEIIRTSPVLTITYLTILVASNFVFMYIPSKRFRGIRLHYIIFILDIALIVIGAFIFTNLNIQFLLAIFLTLFISALGRSVKMSILVAVVVNAVYLYISYLTVNEGATFISDNSLLNIPFMFVVALHGSYLAEKSDSEIKEKLELDKINVLLTKQMTSKSKEIESMASFTESLCESFLEAVIILDSEGFIRVFNGSAEKIFGIHKSRAVGSPVKDLSALGEIKNAIMDLQFKQIVTDDREIEMKTGTGVRKINISISLITDKADQEIGILCTAREKKHG